MRPAPLSLLLLMALPSAARAEDPPDDPRLVGIPAPVLVPETLVLPPQTTETLAPAQPVRRRRLELLWGGIGALSVTYAADRFLARELSQDWKPWLPIVGPWFTLADQQRLTDPSRVTATLLVLDGLFQTGGVVLITLGVLLRKDRVVLTLPREAVKPR